MWNEDDLLILHLLHLSHSMLFKFYDRKILRSHETFGEWRHDLLFTSDAKDGG